MDPTKINRLILDKLDSQEIPSHIKGFIRDILQYEKGKLDQDQPHFTNEYKNLLNKYVRQMEDAESE